MTTLLKHYNRHGLVGRCDARCYDAKGPICRCICNGRFHGKGFAQAQQELTVGILGELLIEAGRKRVELRVSAKASKAVTAKEQDGDV